MVVAFPWWKYCKHEVFQKLEKLQRSQEGVPTNSMAFTQSHSKEHNHFPLDVTVCALHALYRCRYSMGVAIPDSGWSKLSQRVGGSGQPTTRLYFCIFFYFGDKHCRNPANNVQFCWIAYLKKKTQFLSV